VKALRLGPEALFCLSGIPARKTNSRRRCRKFQRIRLLRQNEIIGEGRLLPAAAVRSFGNRNSREQVPLSGIDVISYSVMGRSIMPPIIDCDCELCVVEASLESELEVLDCAKIASLFSAYPTLRPYSSPPLLISRLRRLAADTESDHLLRELMVLRPSVPALVESLLVLAFLPLLHRTVRMVAKRKSSLASEDIAQEALRFFVEFMRSGQVRGRNSHFAFVISRGLKRHIFRWASRESRGAALMDELKENAHSRNGHVSFERITELRHFLDRCVTRGILTEKELNLLVDFKLIGGQIDESEGSNGTSSNAIRQKLKRLLGKLRRVAK